MLLFVVSLSPSLQSIASTYQIATVKVQHRRLQPRRARIDRVHVELEGLALDVFVRVGLGDVLRCHGWIGGERSLQNRD